jgi:hypothetical protein
MKRGFTLEMGDKKRREEKSIGFTGNGEEITLRLKFKNNPSRRYL